MAPFLQQLTQNDSRIFFDMLKRIGKNENAFTNPVNAMSFEQYRRWLIEQNDWAMGRNLPDGYVAQTCFWLMEQSIPIGIGKIRHQLTAASREFGGNIGYAIDPIQRGHGYGTEILKQLLIQARNMKIKEILLTVEKNNVASKNVCLSNGGELFKENEYRWFFRF